nr:hypothetical protein CFP56_52543 [Quercus suber]
MEVSRCSLRRAVGAVGDGEVSWPEVAGGVGWGSLVRLAGVGPALISRVAGRGADLGLAVAVRWYDLHTRSAHAHEGEIVSGQVGQRIWIKGDISAVKNIRSASLAVVGREPEFEERLSIELVVHVHGGKTRSGGIEISHESRSAAIGTDCLGIGGLAGYEVVELEDSNVEIVAARVDNVDVESGVLTPRDWRGNGSCGQERGERKSGARTGAQTLIGMTGDKAWCNEYARYALQRLVVTHIQHSLDLIASPLGRMVGLQIGTKSEPTSESKTDGARRHCLILKRVLTNQVADLRAIPMPHAQGSFFRFVSTPATTGKYAKVCCGWPLVTAHMFAKDQCAQKAIQSRSASPSSEEQSALRSCHFAIAVRPESPMLSWDPGNRARPARSSHVANVLLPAAGNACTGR